MIRGAPFKISNNPPPPAPNIKATKFAKVSNDGFGVKVSVKKQEDRRY